MTDLQDTILRPSESNRRLKRVAIILVGILAAMVLLVAVNEYHRSQVETLRSEDEVARIMDGLRKMPKSRPFEKNPKGDTYLLPIPPRLVK